MSETPETAGGLLGRLTGRAKAAAGALTGNDQLAREGRLQEAAAMAEAGARHKAAESQVREEQADLAGDLAATRQERDRLRAEVAAEDRAQAMERERRAEQASAEREAAEARAEAESARRRDERAADAGERAAEAQRVDAAAEAVRLEHEARRAQARAAAIDPEETT